MTEGNWARRADEVMGLPRRADKAETRRSKGVLSGLVGFGVSIFRFWVLNFVGENGDGWWVLDVMGNYSKIGGFDGV